MTPAGFEKLHARAAQLFLEFLADPSAYVHPEKVEQLVPGVLQAGPAADRAVVSRGLMLALDLAPALPGFRFDDPAHRAALLPAEGLQELAQALALRAVAPELQRLIAQADVQRLKDALSDVQLRLLHALPAPDWPARAPAPVDLQQMLDALPMQGLRMLAAALADLDEAIAQRALLKLPPVDAAQDMPRGQACAWLREVYADVVDRWDPHWDALWDVPAAGKANPQLEAA